MTTTPIRPGRTAVEWVDSSSAEWDDAVRRALDELHLTYEELAEQGRTGNFTTYAGRRLWVMIGGTRP